MVGLIGFRFTLHGAHQKMAFAWDMTLQAQSTPTHLSEAVQREVAEKKEHFSPCPPRLTGDGRVTRLCEVEKKQALHGNSSHVLATLIQNVINIQLQEFRKA